MTLPQLQFNEAKREFLKYLEEIRHRTEMEKIDNMNFEADTENTIPLIDKLMLDTELEIKRRINCVVRKFKFDLYKCVEEKFTRNEEYRRNLSQASTPPTPKELADKIFPIDETQYAKYEPDSSLYITSEFDSADNEKLKEILNEDRDNKKFASDVYTTLERKLDEYFDTRKRDAYIAGIRFELHNFNDLYCFKPPDADGYELTPEEYVSNAIESSTENLSSWGLDFNQPFEVVDEIIFPAYT